MHCIKILGYRIEMFKKIPYNSITIYGNGISYGASQIIFIFFKRKNVDFLQSLSVFLLSLRHQHNKLNSVIVEEKKT